MDNESKSQIQSLTNVHVVTLKFVLKQQVITVRGTLLLLWNRNMLDLVLRIKDESEINILPCYAHITP